MCTSDFANSWPANAQIHFPLYWRHYHKKSWDDGFSNTIKDMTLDDNLCIGTVTYGWDGRIILACPHISVIAPQTFVWWTIRHSCSTISCPIFLIYQEYFCDRVNINIYDTQRPLLCESNVSKGAANIHATFPSPLSSAVWKCKLVKTLSLMFSFKKLLNCNNRILILTTRR